MNKEIIIEGQRCILSDNNITIKNSYKIKDKYIMKFVDLLYLKSIELGFKYTRSKRSWAKEIEAHNRLYKLGLFRSHTIDTDLSENESRFRLFIYNIISI